VSHCVPSLGRGTEDDKYYFGDDWETAHYMCTVLCLE